MREIQAITDAHQKNHGTQQCVMNHFPHNLTNFTFPSLSSKEESKKNKQKLLNSFIFLHHY